MKELIVSFHKGQFISSPTTQNAGHGKGGFYPYAADDEFYQQDGQYSSEMSLLPATLQFVDEAQDAFFAAIISEVNSAAVHFKLAPAYSLYLTCHYLISPDFRPELGQTEHGHVVSATTRKMAVAIEKTVQVIFLKTLHFLKRGISTIFNYLLVGFSCVFSPFYVISILLSIIIIRIITIIVLIFDQPIIISYDQSFN